MPYRPIPPHFKPWVVVICYMCNSDNLFQCVAIESSLRCWYIPCVCVYVLWRLSEVSLDIAEDRETGRPRAFEVEHCQCPPGYRGLSCEVENAGPFRRSDEDVFIARRRAESAILISHFRSSVCLSVRHVVLLCLTECTYLRYFWTSW